MIKYKVLHIILWVVVSIFFMVIDYDWRAPFLPQLFGTMIASALTIPACYYAAYILTPRYLYKKKIQLFVVSVLVLVIVSTVVTYIIALFIYYLLTGLPMFRSVAIVLSISVVLLFYNVLLISISCAAKIITDRFSMEQRLIEAEKERLTTELNFLRSQVNPHYLFNVMNTIYFQIDKDNTQARASVEKLSEMLRYQLYECTTDKIDIRKEIDYIKNYVAIQTLRMEKGTDVKLCVDDTLESFTIAPLLLLPMVENAFKHISHFKKTADNKIHISLKNAGGNFYVNVSNTYQDAEAATHLLQSGGLGVQNLKRRLELLYPGKYELNTARHDQLFETMLKINYND